MAELLQGKNALITGAGRGIGRAVAIALAKEGVNVGLLARSEENLKAVAKEVEAEGVKAVIATADVSSYEEVTTAIETLKNGLGSIDILINNAGISKFGKFLELDVADWEKNHSSKLNGCILCNSCSFTKYD